MALMVREASVSYESAEYTAERWQQPEHDPSLAYALQLALEDQLNADLQLALQLQLGEESQSSAQLQMMMDMETAFALQQEEGGTQAFCRFCYSIVIQEKNKAECAAYCAAEECQRKGKLFCDQIHSCGHPCAGFRREHSCCPCLQCRASPDACPVCLEDQESLPCVRLECGHLVHHSCIEAQIGSAAWQGKQIGFSILNCPAGCGRVIDHPAFAEQMEKHVHLRQRLGGEAQQQAVKDGLCTSDAPMSQEEALAKYSYYECFQCRNPFCGGRVNCHDGVDEPERAPESILCPDCVCAGQTTCVTHGRDNIGFKCYHCCSAAVWFCFGNRHLCDGCHSVYNDYKTPETVPCDPTTCPLQGSHPSNPCEFSLGCAMCAPTEACTDLTQAS